MKYLTLTDGSGDKLLIPVFPESYTVFGVLSECNDAYPEPSNCRVMVHTSLAGGYSFEVRETIDEIEKLLK